MEIRLEKAFLIFRKDWKEISRNWQVILPIIAVPLVLTIVLPVIMIYLPGAVYNQGVYTGDVTEFIKNIPSEVRMQISMMDSRQAMIYIVLVYLFAPFFLIIPLMASSVIASDSFAGEKERKTIEALLATPISDDELLLGKILVSFIPSMTVTILSFTVYTIVVDLLTYDIFNGKYILPNTTWLLLIFGAAPAVAFATIGLIVGISARVKGFREAQEISGVLIIPIVMLIAGQATGAFFLGTNTLLIMVVVLVILDIMIFYIGKMLFEREKILVRLD